MTSHRTIAVIALGAGIACLANAADAQTTARRHIQCYVQPPLTLPNPFGPGGSQTFWTVTLTNNTPASIPGNTTITYTVAGKQYTYRATSALSPGQGIGVQGPSGSTSGPCDAWYPQVYAPPKPPLGTFTAPPVGKLSPY